MTHPAFCVWLCAGVALSTQAAPTPAGHTPPQPQVNAARMLCEVKSHQGKPTLFVMEGGYAVEEIGINAVNVLEGFEGSAE